MGTDRRLTWLESRRQENQWHQTYRSDRHRPERIDVGEHLRLRLQDGVDAGVPAPPESRQAVNSETSM